MCPHLLAGLLLFSWNAAASEFVVEAAAGSLVTGTLAAPVADAPARALLLDASGRHVRAFEMTEDGRIDYQFVAGTAGPYRLRPETAALPWQDHRDPPHDLAALEFPVADAVPADPRLRALLALPEAARAERMPRFWQEVHAAGTPLHTPLASGLVRLTFLWRGQPDTRNVRLYWPAQSANLRPFSRLPATDLWFLELEVPAGTRASYRIAPDVPAGERRLMRRMMRASAQADPLNPSRWRRDPRDGEYDSDSLLALPGSPTQHWTTAVPSTLQGRVEEHRIASARLGNSRRLSVYLPHGYAENSTYPLLLVFDRQAYLRDAALPATLDKLIAAGRIPPLMAVLIDNSSAEARARELPCNYEFAAFMTDELLPWLHRHWTLERDPSRVVVAGASYGGLAAACLAWRHPQRFGRVLAQSGSFWWGPAALDADPAANGGGWLARQFAEAPRSNLSFYLEAGLLEIRRRGDSSQGILESTRELAEVLRRRGYPVQLHEYAGGHDYAVWREGIAEGLIALLGGD
ncbi:enterochelin esterase [Stenotrophomonas sp. MMGLT7]|uniref:enterochelin esterase n=1 Tax=Stenotrophomonas sp. MMGLT7 TaxID=2901227 RepID=UPI001E6503E7|nr:enterochelin esterase [Stenotrophomonas sp. MMGLT7]MCD7099325.1 enterochelin esterase [Stenotrophomonas sp. MMGLT7]